MKYIYFVAVLATCFSIRSQCLTSVSYTMTAPTCSTCCNGSFVVSHSCAITYTIVPPGTTSPTAYNVCGGTTCTVYVGMASTACCGSSVGTATVFVPMASPSSITEVKDSYDFILSPNPGNGRLSLELPRGFSSSEIKIYDTSGKLVFEDTVEGIKKDIETELKNGIYFVCILNREDKQKIIRKIVIQK